MPSQVVTAVVLFYGGKLALEGSFEMACFCGVLVAK